MTNITKEVRFDIYCAKCVHYDKAEHEDPCFECLNHGWNYESHKPVKFEEAAIRTKTRNSNKH